MIGGQSSRQGFTLLEILVALFVFAILGTLAVIGLRHVIDTRQRIQQDDLALRQVQFAVVLMRHDINQLIDRSVINEGGVTVAALAAQGSGFSLTRTGYVDPTAASRRSDMQRVAYLLEGGRLIRRTWAVLDRTAANKPLNRVLLNGVTAMQIQYVDMHGEIVSSWPLATGSNIARTQQSNLPRGLLIRLRVKRLGQLSFALPVTARGRNVNAKS